MGLVCNIGERKHNTVTIVIIWKLAIKLTHLVKVVVMNNL